MSQQATQLTAPIATVEVLTYIGNPQSVLSDPSQMIPHTFLKVTDVNGNINYVGFAPQQTGIVGIGAIFNNAGHLAFNSSGPIALTASQGVSLQQYINGAIINPPYYTLPEGSQCAVWALNGLLYATTGVVIQSPIPPDSSAPNPLGTLITLLFNPYTTVGLNTEIKLGRFLSGVWDFVTNSTAIPLATTTNSNGSVTTQYANGSALTQSSGTAASAGIPGAPQPLPTDTGLHYKEITYATTTARIYDNLVMYSVDSQTGMQYWSVPNQVTGGTTQTTQFANGQVIIEQLDAHNVYQDVSFYDSTGQSIGTPTNTFDLLVNSNLGASNNSTPDPTQSVSSNTSTLLSTSVYTVNGVGNVNTASGNTAYANNQIAGLRPGDFNLTSEIINSSLAQNVCVNPNISMTDAIIGAALNTVGSGVLNTVPTDPLVLDLNGDGVKLTDYQSAPVLFDINHDGGSKEQTGWVSAQDGIVVYDLNGNGKIDDISETMSEYFTGTAGTGGNAGTKPFTNGFAALKSLDSNANNQFDSGDAAPGSNITTTSRILMNDQGSVFGSDAATVNGTSFASVDARAANDAVFETRRAA